MKLLKELYLIHSPSHKEERMAAFIQEWCHKHGLTPEVDAKGNVLVTKGQAETYPCVVAHMDEVHRTHPEDLRICQAGGLLYGFSESEKCQLGIGADDKNGIWVALNAIQKIKCIKCAFFVGEEIGCTGSGAVDMKFFDDVRFVIQCDRKGKDDIIYNASSTPLCDDTFVTKMNAAYFGYKKAYGMMTDVMELRRRGLNVCCCNLSCGYYNPHTDRETTVFAELKNCLSMVLMACRNIKEVCPMEKYTAPKVSYTYPTTTTTNTRSYTGAYYDDWDWDKYSAEKRKSGSGSTWNWEQKTMLSFASDWKVGDALDALEEIDRAVCTDVEKKEIARAITELRCISERMRDRYSLAWAYYNYKIGKKRLETILELIDQGYIDATNPVTVTDLSRESV